MNETKIQELISRNRHLIGEDDRRRQVLSQQTEVRQAIYGAIASRVAEEKPVPTLREIGDELGVAHTGVGRSIDHLIAVGLLKRTVPDKGRERSAPRSVTLTAETELPPMTDTEIVHDLDDRTTWHVGVVHIVGEPLE
jgi:hypothetical protein